MKRNKVQTSGITIGKVDRQSWSVGGPTDRAERINNQDSSQATFLETLASVGKELEEANLDLDIKSAIKNDLRIIEIQIQDKQPRKELINNRLTGILDLVASSGIEKKKGETMISLIKQAVQQAKNLF